MSRVLDDIVVLDVTQQSFSALSAVFIGDFGARVIRLEFLREPRKSTEGKWNYNADLIHRNKESVALDPQSDEGRQLLRDLLRRADVLVTDRQLSELEALQFDYASASALRPDIIFGRISGFGPKGPDRDLPVIDELAAARTGMMPILPQPGQPPVYTGTGTMYANLMLVFGVMTALLHRVGSGEGQEVDVSLFGGNMYGAALDIQAFLAIGKGERFLNPISRLDVSNPMSGSLYPTADGRWVTLTMPDTDRWCPIFSRIVGLQADDVRFDSHEKRCDLNRLELLAELEEAFKKHPGSYWRSEFQEKQLSADVIEQFDYAAGDPQVVANRYIIDLDHPSFGKIKSVGFPLYLEESPARLERLAPCVGQHTLSVLQELLDYSPEKIRQLSAAGAIA